MKTRRGGGTAIRYYKDKVKDVRKVMEEIERAIKDHEKEQAADPNDYGYVGDMGHVYAELSDISRFLRGQG